MKNPSFYKVSHKSVQVVRCKILQFVFLLLRNQYSDIGAIQSVLNPVTTGNGWIIGFWIKGCGKIMVPINVANPKRVIALANQYQVFDDNGIWQPAGDATLSTNFGTNAIIWITSNGAFTEGRAYLVKAPMRIE